MDHKKPKNELKKPRNAYNLFMEDARQKEENKGLRFGDYGRMWRELPEEQKNLFQEKAKEDQLRYQEQLKKWQESQKEVVLDSSAASNLEGDTTSTNQSQQSDKLEFPFGTIKNIVKKDKDIKMIRKSAMCMIVKATEMFLEDLTSSAEGVTLSNKRKNINLNDLVTAVNTGQRFHFIKDANIIEEEELPTKSQPTKTKKTFNKTATEKQDKEAEEQQATTTIQQNSKDHQSSETEKKKVGKKPIDDGTSNKISNFFKAA